jgi:hypothetical protein
MMVELNKTQLKQQKLFRKTQQTTKKTSIKKRSHKNLGTTTQMISKRTESQKIYETRETGTS